MVALSVPSKLTTWLITNKVLSRILLFNTVLAASFVVSVAQNIKTDSAQTSKMDSLSCDYIAYLEFWEDYNLNGIVEWPEVINMPTDDLYIKENRGHLLIYSDIEQEMTITIHESDSTEIFKRKVWNRKLKPYCINIPDLELKEGDYRVIVRFAKSSYNISGVMRYFPNGFKFKPRSDSVQERIK